jgi:hypothetical protein
MHGIKFFFAIALVTFVFVILGAISFRPFMIFIARMQSRGSITKVQAAVNNCNGKDVICVMKNGKIVTQKQPAPSMALTQQDHMAYASNVALAVAAIRAYTHVPNLNLSLLNSNTPTHITYYCTPDNKCWAVNNYTHQVIPSAK